MTGRATTIKNGHSVRWSESIVAMCQLCECLAVNRVKVMVHCSYSRLGFEHFGHSCYERMPLSRGYSLSDIMFDPFNTFNRI